jgi:hypothetical protein
MKMKGKVDWDVGDSSPSGRSCLDTQTGENIGNK